MNVQKLFDRVTKNWTRKQTYVAYVISQAAMPLGALLAILVLTFELMKRCCP